MHALCAAGSVVLLVSLLQLCAAAAVACAIFLLRPSNRHTPDTAR